MSTNKNKMLAQLLSFISYVVPAAIGILSFMLLVRSAKPVVLGQFIIYLAAVMLFEMIKSGGLQTALVMRLSGADVVTQKKVIGSAYFLGGIFSFAISCILLIIYLSGVFHNTPEVETFCGWYAMLGLITLPIHITEAIAVSKQQFKFLIIFRILQSTSSFVIAIFAFLTEATLQHFATVHLLFQVVLVFIMVLSGKANITFIRHKAIEEVKALIGIVKYSMATLATTNILKSADTFLIGSLMGPLAVAKYAIPLKLTELFDIPLRSLSSTAFPQLAAMHNEKNGKGFKESLVQYISWAYMLYIPALIGAFIFAPYLVYFIGGAKFQDTTPIFRVFVLYGLFLPFDRMTGISLDGLQRPDQNFIKVSIMAGVNIIADIVAIVYFQSLEWVAFASVLNAATGSYIGYVLLKRNNYSSSNKLGVLCVTYSKSFLKAGYKRYVQKVA